MPYLYAPLRTKLLPTIEDAMKALAAADNDDPTTRDVRKLMSLEMRMVGASPRLKGHVLTRRVALSAFDWDIKAREDANPDLALKAKARLRRVIEQMNDWHTDTPLFGASAVELNWDTKDTRGTVPVVLKRYQPVEIETNGHDPRAMSILADIPDVLRRPLAAEPEASWLLDRDDSFERGGLLRSLVFTEILANEGLQEWANWLRKLKGIILAKWEEWASDKTKLTAVEMLKGVAKNNYGATGKDITFEFQKIVDALGGTSFKDFKHEMEADRAITILGQANTSQLPDSGGSRAALQVLDLIRADIYFADLRRMQRLFNDQLLLWDARFNIDLNATEAPYIFIWNLKEEMDPLKKAQIIDLLIGPHGAGLELSAEEVYKFIEFNKPISVPEVIAGNKPAPIGGLPA